MAHSTLPAWWGSPRDFKDQPEDRRVSWLELFYDLVYVTAIAAITHHLSAHISVHTFLEYACLFCLIYWGWLNGSLYYDLHGNDGLRTRLMTLWQMMIIAALTITIHHLDTGDYRNVTIVFMLMQLYITYIWFSVGFYDKSHRRYNLPYTVLYLASFGLMGLSLAVPNSWLSIIFPLVLLFNYLPPILTRRLLRRDHTDLDLSSSMFERLGLFTIIVFGETVLGVVNGISDAAHLSFADWLNFALALAIVFSLWWILFTIVGRREVMKGFLKATILELVYIPALISLGIIGVCFSSFFRLMGSSATMQTIFSLVVACFLACVYGMTLLLRFTGIFTKMKKRMRAGIATGAIAFLLFATLPVQLTLPWYLALVLGLLLCTITYLNSVYYGTRSKEEKTT